MLPSPDVHVLKFASFNANGVLLQKDELLSFLQDHSVNVLLLQETNLKPHHKFNCKHQAFHCSVGNRNGDILNNNFLHNTNIQMAAPVSPIHYHSPTHSWDILDLFMAKGNPHLPPPDVICALKSDHRPIICTLSCKSVKVEISHPQESHYDWAKFEPLVDQHIITASPVLATPADIDAAVTCFATQLNEGLASSKKYAPQSTYCKPVPREILKKIKQKNHVRKLYQQTRYPAYKTEYNHLTAEVKTEISKFRSETWTKTVSEMENNPWLLSRQLKVRSTTIPPLQQTSELVSSEMDQASIFANQYEQQLPLHLQSSLRTPSSTRMKSS